MDKQVDMGFESEGDDKNMNAAVRRRRAEQKAEADRSARANLDIFARRCRIATN